MHKTIIMVLFILIAIVPIDYSQSSNEKKESNHRTPDTDAVVYFYRYKQFEGYAVEPPVYCDEVELARMDNGRYFMVKLNPAKHTFRSNDKQSGIEMDLKGGGQEYYIRVEIVTGFFKQRGRLVMMTNEQGAYEITKLKPLGASKVKDRSRVVIDEHQQK